MDTQTIIATTILLGSFFLLISLGNKIIYAIGISTLITTLYLDIPIQSIVQNIVRGINCFSLMAVPFFILMGEIMRIGGITKRLVRFANALVGRFHGGLGMVNIVASMFFGGISGSPTADCSSIGAMMIPMMEESGYDTEFSAAVTMTSSIQGMLIPPSHLMVIYAMATGGLSIGFLFLAGAVPGVFLGIVLMIYVYFVSLKHKYPVGDKFNIKNLFHTGIDAFLGLATVLIVVVGVVMGVFTATESAAIACVYAFIITFFVYRELKIQQLKSVLFNCVKTISIIMYLVGVSAAFGWLIAYLQIPAKILDVLFSLTTNKFLVLILINIFLLMLGTIMDMICSILIVTPILLPIVTAVGMSPIHFGVVMILNLGIGLITPPVGVILFTVSAISKLDIESLTKSLLPFYLIMIIVLFVITFIPDFSMWLPSILFKG